MAWETAAILLAVGLIVALFTNMPVGFAFGVVNVIAAWFVFGNVDALSFLVQAAYSSVANIYLTAVPFFVLMGTIFVRSNLSNMVLDHISKAVAGLKGSGAYTAVAGGVVLGALMGASVASTAVLGSTLIAELRRRKYSKLLSVGTILGSGTLAVLIPPSLGAVLVGSLAGISISDLLLAGIGPAIVLSTLLIIFITVRIWFFEPDIIDPVAADVTFADRMIALAKLTPLLLPIFAVTGVIYFGIATATEASATGALTTLIIAYAYRQFSFKEFIAMIKDAVVFSAMIMFIVVSSKAYSQILAITGISQGLTELLAGTTAGPTVAVALVLGIALVLGCFMDSTSVIFVVTPVLVGVMTQLNIDPVWFGALFVMVVGTGAITPPFGLNLFTVKGVAPPEITMRDIYWISIPPSLIEIATAVIVLLNPGIVKILL